MMRLDLKVTAHTYDEALEMACTEAKKFFDGRSFTLYACSAAETDYSFDSKNLLYDTTWYAVLKS